MMNKLLLKWVYFTIWRHPWCHGYPPTFPATCSLFIVVLRVNNAPHVQKKVFWKNTFLGLSTNVWAKKASNFQESHISRSSLLSPGKTPGCLNLRIRIDKLRICLVHARHLKKKLVPDEVLWHFFCCIPRVWSCPGCLRVNVFRCILLVYRFAVQSFFVRTFDCMLVIVCVW